MFTFNQYCFHVLLYTELNVEYLTAELDLPITLEKVSLNYAYIKVPLNPIRNDPPFVAVDKLEAFIALEKPPPTRPLKDILSPDAYEQVIKTKKQREENRIKAEKERKKAEEILYRWFSVY